MAISIGQTRSTSEEAANPPHHKVSANFGNSAPHTVVHDKRQQTNPTLHRVSKRVKAPLWCIILKTQKALHRDRFHLRLGSN